MNYFVEFTEYDQNSWSAYGVCVGSNDGANFQAELIFVEPALISAADNLQPSGEHSFVVLFNNIHNEKEQSKASDAQCTAEVLRLKIEVGGEFRGRLILQRIWMW